MRTNLLRTIHGSFRPQTQIDHSDYRNQKNPERFLWLLYCILLVSNGYARFRSFPCQRNPVGIFWENSVQCPNEIRLQGNRHARSPSSWFQSRTNDLDGGSENLSSSGDATGNDGNIYDESNRCTIAPTWSEEGDWYPTSQRRFPRLFSRFEIKFSLSSLFASNERERFWRSGDRRNNEDSDTVTKSSLQKDENSNTMSFEVSSTHFPAENILHVASDDIQDFLSKSNLCTISAPSESPVLTNEKRVFLGEVLNW